jgi:hydroxymethylpyrimidine pyrophosphatase-like HAD family hydrolase
MFSGVGLSIAMGNASPAVKAAAQVTTAGNDADGFARAIDEFVLHRAAT